MNYQFLGNNNAKEHQILSYPPHVQGAAGRDFFTHIRYCGHSAIYISTAPVDTKQGPLLTLRDVYNEENKGGIDSCAVTNRSDFTAYSVQQMADYLLVDAKNIVLSTKKSR